MIVERMERGGTWVRLVMDAGRGTILSLELVRALRSALAATRARNAVKWLTIESADADFSFGAKIQEHLPPLMTDVLPETHRLFRDLLAFPTPTAALVQGRCLGGGFELALACDDIIATPDAIFGLPEVTLAAFPPAAAALLPARVGTSRAARAIVTGDPRPAAYWHESGLVSLVARDVRLEQAAGEWFDRHLSARSAVALSHAAQAARLALRAQAEPALDAAERLYLDSLLQTQDAVEGVQAWIDKREPKWEDQ